MSVMSLFCFFFFNDTATTEIYTLSLHDALPISLGVHEKDEEWFSAYAEHADDGVYDIRHVPNTYALGEEKTLVKHATETRAPRFVDNPDGSRRPGMPPDVGIIVNNSETLLKDRKSTRLNSSHA